MPEGKSNSVQIAEISKFEDIKPGYDSQDVLTRVQENIWHDLREHGNNENVADWLNQPSEERFQPDTMTDAIGLMIEDIDDGVIQLQAEGWQKLEMRRQLLTKIKNVITQPDNKLRVLLENIKVYGLSRAVRNEKYKEFLKKNAFSAYSIDHAVTSVVVDEIVDAVQNYDPGQRSQNSDPKHYSN